MGPSANSYVSLTLQTEGRKVPISNFTQPAGGRKCQPKHILGHNAFAKVTNSSESRSNTLCVVVERPDHQCGDDLVFCVNKVITDHTYCACVRSPFKNLGLWRKLYDCSMDYLTTSQCILKCVRLTFLTTSNRLKSERGTFRPPV